MQAGEPSCRQESHSSPPSSGKHCPCSLTGMGNKGTGRHRVAVVAVTKETSRDGETSSGGMLGQRQGVRLRGQRDALEEKLPILFLCFLR